MADIPGWHQQLQQLQARLEDLAQQQIQAWHQERAYLMTRAQSQVAAVTGMHLNDRRAVERNMAELEQFIMQTQGNREVREQEQSPEYQAWEHEQAQIARDEWAIAQAQGWAAEQRFAEQELAFDEDQLRRAAGEPLSAADVDNWEHPFDWPTQAEQQAYEDRPYDLMEERAHFGEEMQRALPYDAILLDTTNPMMESDFQALLTRLDQRLEALIKETDTDTQQLQQKQGVRY